MGELMPGIPNLPGDETSWSSFVDQFETLKKGDKPISLTNWDDTDTVPAVAAGSALEIAGATYRFPSEAIIQSESGTASGVVYVVVKTNDPDANSATAYFTNTAPEWRDDLNGWYDTTGANRYTGHLMDWDGATAYTGKRVFTAQARGGEVFTVGADGQITTEEISVVNINSTGAAIFNEIIPNNGAYGSENISAGGTFLIPVGCYIFSSALNLSLQIYDGSNWTGLVITQGSFPVQIGCVFSDGVNFRINNGSGSSSIIHYRKIW